ncbi:Dihydrosphingosine 1-phosphate phosphatase LCB3 [Spathaspora sp. JA1]|nr:Dihydrosphingosine 1-phosphate phosphatase LCB3 [Spathaspora sp. JA1]
MREQEAAVVELGQRRPGKKTSKETSKVSASNETELDSDDSDHTNDAGNQPNDHYKARLSAFRYRLRSKLLPLIRAESTYLHKLQSKLRHPILDYYFAWTANLASHTFYVLMLPPPLWFGASDLARDLVSVLGLGIYFTGFLKDFFCLPRPRSPPLHRITMSSYTTQEYGFPSSHSANATAVTLLLMSRIIHLDISQGLYFALIFGLTIYYFSLIFGRLYCGMHGFLDILIGSLVGISLFMFRYFWGKQWDQLLFSNSLGPFASAIIIIAMYLSLIHVHSEPVDNCPCFDDSVSFIGVLIGLDLSGLVAYETQYFAKLNPENDPILLPFDSSQSPIKTIMRFILGVTLVVIWKTISKPVIFTILPPIYKFIGVNFPRRNYISTAHTKTSTRNIRSASISNDTGEIGNIDTFIRGITAHNKRDEIGPSTDIDYFEMLDYNRENNLQDQVKQTELAGVFKPRYDVEIIGRVIVYAGVSTTAVWGVGTAIKYIPV